MSAGLWVPASCSGADMLPAVRVVQPGRLRGCSSLLACSVAWPRRDLRTPSRSDVMNTVHATLSADFCAPHCALQDAAKNAELVDQYQFLKRRNRSKLLQRTRLFPVESQRFLLHVHSRECVESLAFRTANKPLTCYFGGRAMCQLHSTLCGAQQTRSTPASGVERRSLVGETTNATKHREALV